MSLIGINRIIIIVKYINMKKFYLSVLSLLLCFISVQAQYSIVPGAAEAVNSQGAVAGFSVGQIAIETVADASGSVTFGIRQDFSNSVSAIASNPIKNVVVGTGETIGNICLNDYFESDVPLTFTVVSSDNSVANPIVDGQNLSFELGNDGVATITVVATASSGKNVSVEFSITVGDKTSIAQISQENEPTVSISGHIIYVSNIQCGEVFLFDITGKRIYACRNAQNTQMTVGKAGTYVLMLCGKQQNIVIQ